MNCAGRETGLTAVCARWPVPTKESEYSLDQKTNSSAFFGVREHRYLGFSQPQFEQEMESYAVFGQIDWDLTDRITVSAGARYINEENGPAAISDLS